MSCTHRQTQQTGKLKYTQANIQTYKHTDKHTNTDTHMGPVMQEVCVYL